MPFTISAGVGFVAVSGVSMLAGPTGPGVAIGEPTSGLDISAPGS
jgi:hypothetical protein